MKKNKVDFLYELFGIGTYFSLILGGVIGISFVLSLIVGGQVGRIMAEFTYNKLLPFTIQITTAIIFLGMLGMVIKKEKALSLTSDKDEADLELKKIKN